VQDIRASTANESIIAGLAVEKILAILACQY
jgi:hypothetical protein